MLRSIFREPLAHFVFLGAALFAASSLMNGPEPDDNRGTIVVTAGKVQHIATVFTRTWQRPPTDDELTGLVHDYIREEVAYREGLAMGLDRDDTVIRRRIRQKLEFVAQDIAAQIEPTETDLRTYFESHKSEFTVDPALSFRHVFFDPQSRGDLLADDIAQALVLLKDDTSADFTALGDRTLLEPLFVELTQREIASIFGDRFANALSELETEVWTGPVQSAYGSHLVRIDAREGGQTPEFAQVESIVHREWQRERTEELTEKYYANLVDAYDITIEWPDARAAPSQP